MIANRRIVNHGQNLPTYTINVINRSNTGTIIKLITNVAFRYLPSHHATLL